MAPTIRIQDIADILIMTFLIYQLYTWFRGTRAIQVLLGLGVVTLIYFATRFLGLYMTSWVLQELGTVLIILIIVVFQSEIRQALYRFSLLRHMLDSSQEAQHGQFQEIAETIFAMAARRTGTLLVFQRSEPLNELVSNGVQLDCEISPQILESIFYDGAPLHDGAALIRDGRIALASCHLPLSISPDIPQNLGTRHRAALGLSERSDAVIVVVSEERGDVSLATAGKLRLMNSTTELIAALDEMFHSDKPAPSISVREKIFSNLLPKMALLLGVCVFWALITTRQGQITTVTAPVILNGVPEGLVLLKTTPEEVNVQIKSLSSLSPPPSKLDLTAELDASKAKDGQTNIRIHNSDFSLPSGLSITGISPSSIRITAEKKLRKSVAVKASLKGKLPSGLSSVQVVCEPEMVDIEGPASQVASIDSVLTDDIDATRLKKGNEYQKNIRPLQKQVSLLRDTPVTIRLITRTKRR
ncbi:MAG: diadenylate cyclase CdaA [Geobacteraceae bacterium]|nr:diadenylate cyclase CdaA [Geobacteraceae bacterium]